MEAKFFSNLRPLYEALFIQLLNDLIQWYVCTLLIYKYRVLSVVSSLCSLIITVDYPKSKKIIVLDVSVCSIAVYFYELCRILTSPQGESKYKQRVKIYSDTTH